MTTKQCSVCQKFVIEDKKNTDICTECNSLLKTLSEKERKAFLNSRGIGVND